MSSTAMINTAARLRRSSAHCFEFYVCFYQFPAGLKSLYVPCLEKSIQG